MYTWRYFATYCNQEHNWLIPDNVQEEPPKVAARVSPTNLGLLLNARQVACEFGYLTVPEFVEQTMRTMETVLRLPRERGHLFNWYDTRTLKPLSPRFISTVDSGNLAASLITLKSGCLDLLQRPLLSPRSARRVRRSSLRAGGAESGSQASRACLREALAKFRGWIGCLSRRNCRQSSESVERCGGRTLVRSQQTQRSDRAGQASQSATYAPWLLRRVSSLSTPILLFSWTGKC